MSSRVLNPSRVLAGLITSAALVAFAIAAAPAGAASGSGEAIVRPATHDKGRTLSGQGVKILPGAGATAAEGKLNLPIGELEPGAAPAAKTGAALSFKKGGKTVALTDLSFDLAAGTLVGDLGGTKMPVFWLGAPPAVNSTTGSISLKEGALRLTGEAAKSLRQKLDLPRALMNKGVGMLWLNAQAAPTHAAARPVVSGSLSWGFKTSWRGYVLSPPQGSIEVSAGATATGPLTSPSSTYGFPAGAGSFTAGLYGAGNRLAVSTAGSVKWAKPGHGINEVRFSNLEIELDGSDSWLIADVRAEIGAPTATDDVRLAQLNLAGVTPSYSAGGKTVTWAAIPATLTKEGAASFASFYSAGTELDPVTISVGLG